MTRLRPLAAALALAGAALPATANQAEVVSLVGRAEARDAGAADFRPATLKQKLRGGAFVRTGDSSTMALLMQDNTQLRLNQNSLLQIKETAVTGAPTRLELRGGRAWMNTKGRDANVTIETPNATAAIRGTEWELEVDPAGKTLLAVFSGTVEFSNPLGSVSVGRNEAALAEAGKPPVKVALVNPRDRVQWVNALSIDPARYAEAAKSSAAVRSATDAVRRGDLATARRALEAEKVRGTRTPAVFAMLAELDIVSGDIGRAIGILREGLAAAPRDPELLAQLANAQLLAGRPDEARATLALPRDAETAASLVAEGELARNQGEVLKAITAFTRATLAAPADDRGWFALGRAQSEREDTTRARRNLAKAIELNAAGAGYHGELGTLETFANRFDPAQQAFDRALAANPADYVALTGLGLLRLKRGDPAGALDAFLRAGVLEPRYARARTFVAVAYYQLGRHGDAIAAFGEAAALDDKDPLPYLFLTQVYTDLFRAGDAVDASREALKRLPFLKSLNQVANNQQGTANLGYSLAFFGLEAWALEVAQQSYSPYQAASHLFLADRYQGEHNKNSELIQGFLTDPTAFGGSNRFATLVPSAGHYRTLGLTYTWPDDKLANPYLRLNGLIDGFGRTAYFIDAERANGTSFFDQVGPDGSNARVKGDRRVDLYALGVGSALTESLGVFGYATRLANDVVLRDFGGTVGTRNKDRGDFGLRYRTSPTSMTWVKTGVTHEERRFDNYFVFSADGNEVTAAQSSFKFRPRDVQARHSLDLTPDDHLSFGYERAKDQREGVYAAATGRQRDVGFIIVATGVGQDVRLESKQGYLSYVRDFPNGLAVEAGAHWERFDQRIAQAELTRYTLGGREIQPDESDTFFGQARETKWNPRVGLSLTRAGYGLRTAWQKWLQPASTSTLGPVATAGIALDDRLVAAGGRGERFAFQAHFEPGTRTHIAFSYDDIKVRNLGQLGFRIPVPQIQFVDLLRNAQLINVNNSDLLEARPDFDEGRLRTASVSLNHMISREWAVAARFARTTNRATIYVRDDDGNIVSSNGDARIPWIPRNLAAVGLTWVSPYRVYLSAQAVYRSERHFDRDNSGRLRSDTTGTVAMFWESANKHLILGAGASGLGSKLLDETWVVDVRWRF